MYQYANKCVHANKPASASINSLLPQHLPGTASGQPPIAHDLPTDDALVCVETRFFCWGISDSHLLLIINIITAAAVQQRFHCPQQNYSRHIYVIERTMKRHVTSGACMCFMCSCTPGRSDSSYHRNQRPRGLSIRSNAFSGDEKTKSSWHYGEQQ